VSRKSLRAVAIAGVFAVAPMVSACAAGMHPQSAMPTQLTEGVNASVHQVDIRNAFVLGPDPGQRLAAGGSAPLYAWFVNHAPSPDRLVAVDAPGVAQSVEITGGSIDLPPGRLVSITQAAGTPLPGATASGTPTPGAPAGRTPAPGASASRTPAGRKPVPTVTVTKPVPGRPAPGASTTATPVPGAPTSGTPTPGAPVSGTPAPSAPAGGQNTSRVILKGLTRDFSSGETVRLTFHFQQAGVVTLTVPIEPRQRYYATYAPAPVGASTPTPSGSATPGNGKTPRARPAGAPKPGKQKKASPAPTA
jgi:copper(I)-binding protein